MLHMRRKEDREARFVDLRQPITGLDFGHSEGFTSHTFGMKVNTLLIMDK